MAARQFCGESIMDILSDGAVARTGPPRRPPGSDARQRRIVVAVLLAAALLVIALTGAVLWRAAQPARVGGSAVARQVDGKMPLTPIDAPLPPVEPMEWKPIAPTDAKAINAAVPFSTLPNPAAAKFIANGSPADVARAADCLAAAMLYEAGDDVVGERAVAQVVLNRVRHPAYPHTVCGVVFQGSERRTGCQFTFTCDNAMTRTPAAPAWARARAIAYDALAGVVFKPVGLATHYHTDWVVPYWSASLEKVTAVKTHLFFRWTGGWGRPRAFYAPYRGVEPVIPQLASLSEAHRPVDAVAGAEGVAAEATAAAAAAAIAAPATTRFVATANNPDVFLVSFGSGVPATSFPELARQACGARPRCLLMAWSSAALTPRTLPASTAQLEAMIFHYLRDPAFKQERMRWDCSAAPRAVPAECLSRQGGLAGPARPVSGSATP
jgi:spore germination cell wall hydrolase CwlJ-like protein